MIRGTTLFATALCVAAFVGDAPAQEASGADDPIFQAMDAELQRARGLRMKDLDNPYFLSAYVSQDESFSVSASFGALQSRGGGKSASISTNVRVGTMELDNTNFSSFSFGGWGGGQAVPTDPDVDALRQALWLDFDSSYKSAAQAIAKKRAYLASNTVKELLPDNQAVETTDVVLPLMELTLDRERWTAIVKRVSAVFREYDFVHGCTVSLQAVAAHQYYLSTDPARHRFPFPYCTFSIDSSTQCDDGMVVSSDWNRMTRTADDLPSEEDLVAVAHEVAKRLGELKDAPTAEDYWGPVLFTGDAAADFFLNTIATPLSDCRQDLGDSGGGRLVDRMGRRIASKLVTVRDDPTQKEWNGQPLLGHFPVDDDGVLPQPITLVDKGFLRTHYMSRIPTKHVKETNGHSRAGDGSAGNVFVEAAEALSREELEKKLVQLAKDEDLEYGLVVESFQGGGGGFSFGGGGSVRLPRPAIVYRVYPDGRRQLERGSAFQPSSYRLLRDIVAMGDDPHLVNTRQSGQLVAVVTPSVLVTDLELRRPSEEFSKPPYTERPKMTAR